MTKLYLSTIEADIIIIAIIVLFLQSSTDVSMSLIVVHSEQ